MDGNSRFVVIVATCYYDPCKDKLHDHQELIDQVNFITSEINSTGCNLDYTTEDVINILNIIKTLNVKEKPHG